ncbi:MAG TPA: DUF2071 domain-containing protein [Flavobacterium sp.]|nr:DUF2071 domain-containing protein [Flavobacterium sp.]
MIQKILEMNAHRPWELPKDSWRYYQEWNDAVFLHWEADLEELKKHVPKELEIDLYEGKPWVSAVAFSMEEIRPRFLPAFSPISNFYEINIRTYIKTESKTGVYFLSIEGGKSLSCKTARLISELPYRFSAIKREMGCYRSSNAVFGDRLDIDFKIGDPVQKKEIDKWLTERYALFQDTKDHINEYEIHHQEWPIREAAVENLELHYPRFRELIGGRPQLAHYSEGVKVIAWAKKKVKKSEWDNK